jgi:hypothetical protein
VTPAGNIDYAAEILVIDAGRNRFVFDDDQLAQGNHSAASTGQVDIFHLLLRRTIRAVK